jgi:sensor histidine kinase YesM
MSISYINVAKGEIGITVKKVGEFTENLHSLKEGDRLGLRGPYGNGFDTEKINEDPADNYFIDIQGIRKRIQELQGGSLEIRSELNHGTRIVIIIPDNRDMKL